VPKTELRSTVAPSRTREGVAEEGQERDMSKVDALDQGGRRRRDHRSEPGPRQSAFFFLIRVCVYQICHEYDYQLFRYLIFEYL
jgi:hypothetical protein